MAMHVVAAEFTVARPTDPIGWAILIAVIFTVIYVIVMGFNSFFSKWESGVKGLFWVVFGFLVLIFLSTERPWENENLVEADISVNTGVQGVQTHTDQAPTLTDDQLHQDDIDSHLYDDGHDHEDYGN